MLPAAQFNTWLATGHRFAGTVIKIAVKLYDNNNSALVLPDIITGATYTKAEEENSIEGLSRVTEFMAGAELYRLRKQHSMAAFMLHQAEEHALHTLFKSATGLQINTHNLDKLLRYCAMVHYKIPAVFPREKEADKRLLSLLQKAYLDTRFKDDFTIGTNELQLITERVAALREMIEM